MRKSLFALITASLLAGSVITGCAASGGVLVPGQNRIILQNLAVEYYNIAEAYINLKNYTKAADYYKLAMRNEELYYQAYYKLGRAYALAGNWNKAMPIYEDMLARDPENAEIAESIAYIHAMKGNSDEAFARYRALIAKYPNDQSLQENYVSLLVDHGRGEIAEKEYFVLKEKFPDSKLISDLSVRIAEMVDNADPDAAKGRLLAFSEPRLSDLLAPENAK